MAEITDFNNTDANNIARWPENMPFSGVNNAGRADEGILARWYHDTDGSLTASGSSNAFTLTSNRTIPALFNNLVLAFTANHAITGPATLNLNGAGAKTIKRFNGSDLAQGDIVSGQPLVAVYKSSPDVWFMMTAPAALTDNMFADFNENGSPGDPAADVGRLYAFDDSGTTMLAYRSSVGTVRVLLGQASQAEMEAAASARQGVSPARQHFHPSAAKFTAYATVAGGVPALEASYNVTSITDNGVGNLIVTFTAAFGSGNWSPGGVVQEAISTTEKFLSVVTQEAGSINVEAVDDAGSPNDPGAWSVFGFGDQ